MTTVSTISPAVAHAQTRTWPVVRRFSVTVGLAAGLILGLLGAVGWLSYKAMEARFEDQAQTVVTLVGQEADRFIESSNLLLLQMTKIAWTTDWVDPEAVAATQRELEHLRDMVPGAFRLFIFDRDGGMRVSSVETVEPGLNARQRDYFQAHVEQDTGLFISRAMAALIDRTPIFVLSRRLSDAAGNFAGVVSVSVRPEVIASFYRSLAFAPNATFTWARADGQRLVREPFTATDALLATPMSAAFAAQVARLPQAGRYEFHSLFEGGSRIAWYQQVGNYPLYVALGIDSQAILGAWLDTIRPYAVFTSAALLALAGLAAYALRWARAEDLYKMRLGEALGHKDLLLREVNHRVKNSLQLVSALLQIQASQSGERKLRQSFDEAVGRVAAIARVHEQLYRSGEVRTVEAAGYLQALCQELEQSARSGPEPWRITLTAEPVRLSTDDAVKLGLILNELVTNAFKYGRPTKGGADFSVEVSLLHGMAGSTSLVVRDYGAGMVTEAVPKATGLGLNLVRGLAEELGGCVRAENAEPGARFRVEFPKPPGSRQEEAGGTAELAMPTAQQWLGLSVSFMSSFRACRLAFQ